MTFTAAVATPAEIATVAQVRETAAGVLSVHVDSGLGWCEGCQDRMWPCSRVEVAQRQHNWAVRRAGELQREMEQVVAATRAALLGPTRDLSLLGPVTAAAPI